MRCKTAHFAVRNGPFWLVKWAESQCETGRIAFLYWPSRMLVLTEPCRGVARTVLHNAKQRKFISSQYAANHYFAVRAFFINFASDKLRLGNPMATLAALWRRSRHSIMTTTINILYNGKDNTHR